MVWQPVSEGYDANAFDYDNEEPLEMSSCMERRLANEYHPVDVDEVRPFIQVTSVMAPVPKWTHDWMPKKSASY